MPSDTVLDKLTNYLTAYICVQVPSNLFHHTNYLALYLKSYTKH